MRGKKERGIQKTKEGWAKKGKTAMTKERRERGGRGRGKKEREDGRHMEKDERTAGRIP